MYGFPLRSIPRRWWLLPAVIPLRDAGLSTSAGLHFQKTSSESPQRDRGRYVAHEPLHR